MNKLLIVVVAGNPKSIEPDGDMTIGEVSAVLLDQFRYDTPAEQWEVRTEDGSLVPPDRKVFDVPGYPEGSKLFLNLRPGIGA